MFCTKLSKLDILEEFNEAKWRRYFALCVLFSFGRSFTLSPSLCPLMARVCFWVAFYVVYLLMVGGNGTWTIFNELHQKECSLRVIFIDGRWAREVSLFFLFSFILSSMGGRFYICTLYSFSYVHLFAKISFSILKTLVCTSLKQKFVVEFLILVQMTWNWLM